MQVVGIQPNKAELRTWYRRWNAQTFDGFVDDVYFSKFLFLVSTALNRNAKFVLLVYYFCSVHMLQFLSLGKQNSYHFFAFSSLLFTLFPWKLHVCELQNISKCHWLPCVLIAQCCYLFIYWTQNKCSHFPAQSCCSTQQFKPCLSPQHLWKIKFGAIFIQYSSILKIIDLKSKVLSFRR